MRISDTEIQKILKKDHAIVEEIVEIGQGIAQKEADQVLVQKVTAEVIAMPDREDFVSDLKARIESGDYNPTGEDIADAMIRRAIADRIR
jgi:anti-sigma28 factor (negative regulator of flagellin synthesis)